MTGIIKNWITNRLGLEIPTESDSSEFRAELANGVLIGEVLRKYGIVSDDEFVSLKQNSTKKHKEKNLAIIYNSLSNAGVDIPQEFIDDLGNEVTGTGVKLLYELYLRLEYGLRKPKLDAKGRHYLRYIGRRAPVWMKEALETKDGFHDRTTVTCPDIAKNIWEMDLQPPGLSSEVAEEGEIESNWFTSLDPIPQPESLSKEVPFIGDSECGQAESLYFAQRTIDFLKKQEDLFLRSVEKAITCTETRNEFNPEFTQSEIKNLSYLPIMKRKMEITNSKKNDMFEGFAKDMDIFNSRWSNIDDTNEQLETLGKIPTYNPDEIFVNGRGNPGKLKESLDLIKTKRLKEMKKVNARTHHRQTSIGKICDQVPISMESKMEYDTLSRLTRLPAPERMLADFIFNAHKEKSIYIQHAIYETRELQKLRIYDVDKAESIRQHHDDYKESIVNFIKSDKPPVLEDEEAVAEAMRLAKLSMATNILSEVVDLAINFSEYRNNLAGETSVGDHFRFGCGSINGEDGCE